MKSRSNFLALMLILSIGLVPTAQSSTETTTPSISTSTSEKSILETLSDYGSLNYYGIYRGSSISNMGSSFQPRVDGTLDPTSPSMLENLITGAYKINKNWMVGAVGHFYFFPWSDPTGGGQRVQLLDPVVFISRPGLINSQGFRLDTRLTFQLPTSKFDALVPRNLATAVSAVFNARYEVPSSKLTLGTFGLIRGYVPSGDTLPTAPTYALTAAPYANYQLTSNLQATIWIDLVQATRSPRSGFISGLQNAPIDIEPGISWDITKNITINPVLNIYPTHPTLASTSIQAFIIAKAF